MISATPPTSPLIINLRPSPGIYSEALLPFEETNIGYINCQKEETIASTIFTMSKATRIPIRTQKAPLPPPFLSQGIVVGDMVYCSGQVGVNPATGKMVEGSIQERTVHHSFLHNQNQYP